MTTITRRHMRDVFPDLFGWLDAPFLPDWRPMAPLAQFRIEDYVEDSTYVVRAELAGIDPDKDLDVTLDDGVLTISAERRQDRETKEGSEFRYGSLIRSVRLPRTAAGAEAAATYDNGILTVRVPLTEKPEEDTRHVPITTTA